MPGSVHSSSELDGSTESLLVDQNKRQGLAPTGTIAQIRNLYETSHTRRSLPWTSEYPDDLEEPLENAESAQYALLLRHKKCYNMRKKLQLDSIVVQSATLKQVLGQVLQGYPGITTTLERLEFSAPFQPFVHRWERLMDARKEFIDGQASEHLELLYTVLEEELRETIREKQDLVSNGVVTFDLIWAIFEPGTLVYNHDADGYDRIYKLKSGDYRTTTCGTFYVLEVCDERY
jgi:hypothetical protein